MEIKNGYVNWNEKNIPCTYAEIEDGTQYYFKQDLQNNNHIVTTSLLELVDPMAKTQNIGLLDANGKLLIPCDNSLIKVIGDDLLLVVPNEAVSENVKEANKLRLDPLAATRLVSTPAQIKEKINAKMGAYGKYELYDQFREGTLCDANGNNLINGEYYSFVAKDNDKVYMAKNILDTDVVEFSISDKKVLGEEIKEVEMPSIEQTTEVVTTVEEVVPSELNNIYGNDLGEEISIPTEEISTQPIEDINMNVSFDEITEETPTEEINSEAEVEVKDEDNIDREADLEKRLNELNAKYDNMNSFLSQYEISDETKDNLEENDNVFNNAEFQVDSIDNIEDDISEYKSVDYAENYEDTTAKEFVKAFEDLRQENSNKDRELGEAREIIEKYKSSSEKDKARIRSLEQKNELATTTIHELRETVAKQSAEIERVKNAADIYKGKADGYKYELAEKDRKIAKLSAQVEGFDYIRSALDRYKAVKDYDNLYKDEEDSYYKVA